MERTEILIQKEMFSVEMEIQVERSWWSDNLVVDEDKAIEEGELIVVPNRGENYSLIGRLTRQEEANTARAETYQLLSDVTNSWALKAKENGYFVDNVLLAVTSLYRSAEFQKELAHDNYNASQGISAHQAGAVFDIDPRGYYVKDGNNIIPVNYKSADFVHGYMEILRDVLHEFQLRGDCHVIWERKVRNKFHEEEYPYRDSVYHVCVSPWYNSR